VSFSFSSAPALLAARPLHIATLATLEKERDCSQSNLTETGALLLICLSIINYRKISVTLLSV